MLCSEVGVLDSDHSALNGSADPQIRRRYEVNIGYDGAEFRMS